MKTIITILTLMLSAVAQARLGETLEQCEKRYGTLTTKDVERAEVWFEKSGVVIATHFHQGRVDAITYTNRDSGAFDDAEKSVLIENNLGKEWKTASPLDSDKNETALYSHDQQLRGYVRKGQLELVFFTFGYLERTAGGKAKEGDAGRRLNGF